MSNKNLRFVWLALFSSLTLFVGGRWNFPLAAWLAPIFALHFIRNSEKGARPFFWLWLATALPMIFAWKGVTAISFIHPAAEPIFIFLMQAFTLIPFAIDRIYIRRWTSKANFPFWVTLVFPVSVSAIDFFLAAGSPFGSFGAIAYTQAGFTPLMQILAFTGMWSISFIVSWFASVANYAWDSDFQWKKIKRGLLTLVGVLALVIGFGLVRMATAEPAQQEVQIAGFSLPEENLVSMTELLHTGEESSFREASSKLHEQQLAQVRVMAQDGAEIVVLQEAAGLGFAEEVEVLLENASTLAREEGIYLVLPTATLDPDGKSPFHNVVRVIDPNGEIVLEHYKYGGTQFEGSVTGSGELQTVETPFGTISAVICWDADFPEVIKQAGEQDLDLLFIPSNDWLEIRNLHADMATYRAVENGMSIFRQTGGGVSVVTDAYGRVVNRVDVFEETSLDGWGGEQMVSTPVGSIDTLYPITGDFFGMSMLVLLLVLLVCAWLSRKLD
jgi:apolipoprotein N-acyltransferase